MANIIRELSILVEYETNGTNPGELSDMLERIAMHASGNGMLTGSTEAEVESLSVKVFNRDAETGDETRDMWARVVEAVRANENAPDALTFEAMAVFLGHFPKAR